MSDVVVVWSVQTMRNQLNLSNHVMKKSYQLVKSIKILNDKSPEINKGVSHHHSCIIQKHISSLMWINCIIFVKTALTDEVCNKSRQLAKGNMTGFGIAGYCEKIGKNRNLTGLILYFYVIPQILVKYEFYFCFCWASDGVTDFDCIKKFVALYIQ